MVEGFSVSLTRRPTRDEAGGYIDRAIDIDIIAIDDVVMDTPELTLPHPRMHLRSLCLCRWLSLLLTGVTRGFGLRVDEMAGDEPNGADG